jgi:Arf-GAP with SH3 domain, ANK repeat and PH domain-containing protein
VEYSQRENNFFMLAALSFWVEDLSVPIQVSPQRRPGKLAIPSDPLEPRLESVPESPEILSAVVSGTHTPQSPPLLPQLEPVQLSNPRADELLLKEVEDGPLFRSRIIGLERKTAALKAKTKKVISRAETLLEAQNAYFEADCRLYDSLQQLSSTNSKAVKPLLTNYLEQNHVQTQSFHRKKVAHLQILINELRRIYDYDIKAAETKKRAFEEESQDYYHSMTKYLAKNDVGNTSKQKEKDSKYQSRRKDYELKRFDYWSYMNDLNGGRKEQEILHHLTQYMDSQLNTLMDATRAEKELKPGLDALLQQVEDASREFKLMRTEREQRRRDLEMAKNIGGDLDNSNSTQYNDTAWVTVENVISDPVNSVGAGSSNKSQWLSDVEDEEKVDPLGSGRRKKEGILFALSRPASHTDPKVMPKLNWHKYVLGLQLIQILGGP